MLGGVVYNLDTYAYTPIPYCSSLTQERGSAQGRGQWSDSASATAHHTAANPNATLIHTIHYLLLHLVVHCLLCFDALFIAILWSAAEHFNFCELNQSALLPSTL